MRVIVAHDDGTVVVDYSTAEGATLARPNFGEDGHAIAVLAETIQFLAPSLEHAMPQVYAIGTKPAPQLRTAPALRVIETPEAPAH